MTAPSPAKALEHLSFHGLPKLACCSVVVHRHSLTALDGLPSFYWPLRKPIPLKALFLSKEYKNNAQFIRNGSISNINNTAV